MKGDTKFKTIHMGHTYYQHVGEGGYSYQLVRTDHTDGARKFTTMCLHLRLSCYGQPMLVEIPVFATTAKIFRDMSDHIRQEAQTINFDPRYISEGGVPLVVTREDGVRLEEHTKRSVLENQYENTLEGLMQKHRIAVFPEFESKMWHAEIFDNESATPTRKALGNSPLTAVYAALQKEVPEFGDALDTHHNRNNCR